MEWIDEAGANPAGFFDGLERLAAGEELKLAPRKAAPTKSRAELLAAIDDLTQRLLQECARHEWDRETFQEINAEREQFGLPRLSPHW